MFTNHHRLAISIAAGVCMAGCSPGNLIGPRTPDPVANKALVAALRSANGTQGQLVFNDQGDHRELGIEISGGQPGSTIEVRINGMVMLSLTLDEFGNASLKFDSNPDESGETPLPMEFPAVTADDAVSVGEMSGSFQEEDDGENGDHDDGDAADVDDHDGDNVDDGDVENADDGDEGNVDQADDGEVDNDDAADVGDVDDSAVDNGDDGEAEDADDGEAENSTQTP